MSDTATAAPAGDAVLLHPRRRTGPRPLPPPPQSRGLGGRASGAMDDQPHYIPVAHSLRAWRQRAGVSQRELADLTQEVVAQDARAAYREKRPPLWKSGLSQFAVNRFENGVHSPLPHNARLLAAALTLALARARQPGEAPVVVTAEKLLAGTTTTLLSFLEGERGKYDAPDRFWPSLGIPNARAAELRGGAIAYPTVADAVRDALVDQTRRQKALPVLRRYAVRDRKHPQYVPSKPRRRFITEAAGAAEA